MANAEQYYDVVRRPVVTEKSSGVQEARNQYTFEVAKAVPCTLSLFPAP